MTCFVYFFKFLYLFMFSSLIFVQDCCCVAVTYEGFCRVRTGGLRCMIFSSFTDTGRMAGFICNCLILVPGR